MGKATVPAGAGATGESFLAALFRAFSIVSSILSIGDDVSSVFFRNCRSRCAKLFHHG